MDYNVYQLMNKQELRMPKVCKAYCNCPICLHYKQYILYRQNGYDYNYNYE